MSGLAQFDITVGKIAGAIFGDITSKFPIPPLMLVPGITFKIRKIMEQVSDVKLLNDVQKEALARTIQISIVPMLFSYELEADLIKKLEPVIQSAAYKALKEE